MINQLKEFYRKNRLIIIVGLAFLLMMQICSRGGKVDKPTVQQEEYQHSEPELEDDTQLKPLGQIYQEERQQSDRRNPEITNLFILMGLVLLVYVATRRGWLQKLAPSIVWVGMHIRRNKGTKERIATITISNHTKESITFSSPILAFSSPFKKTRKFRLKGGTDSTAFPITLMPGTGHRFTINIDAFRQKAGIFKGFSWVKVEVGAGLKNYRSFWKYLF